MNLETSPLRLFSGVACALSVLTGLLGTLGSSSALPIVPPEISAPLLIQAGFQGPIPTDANPITDSKRLARMRREGHLPDTFKRGGCTYNLAGDTGAAYYVKSCP